MKKQTAGRRVLNDLMPKFAQLNDDVLFGEVWSREAQLPPKIRSIVTISALIGKGMVTDALKHHLQAAKDHGVTKEEMAEILTHIAFYAGWPNVWGTVPMAMEVYKDDKGDNHGGFFGQGQPNDAYAKYFIGNSYLNVLSKPNDPIAISNVTFEPGCRNHWHIHHAKTGGGQILICVDGFGWYQEEGKEAQLLRPGDIVEIPPEVKHWHGAAKDCWFSHIAFEVPGTECSNEWLETVDDEAYNALSYNTIEE